MIVRREELLVVAGAALSDVLLSNILYNLSDEGIFRVRPEQRLELGLPNDLEHPPEQRSLFQHGGHRNRLHLRHVLAGN